MCLVRNTAVDTSRGIDRRTWLMLSGSPNHEDAARHTVSSLAVNQQHFEHCSVLVVRFLSHSAGLQNQTAPQNTFDFGEVQRVLNLVVGQQLE